MRESHTLDSRPLEQHMLHDLRKVLPSFAESDRLLKHFMQKQTQSGCARAKVLHTAVSSSRRPLFTSGLFAGSFGSTWSSPHVRARSGGDANSRNAPTQRGPC